MKTFNSFFKSANAMTTLAIVAIALTSVFGFTSCEKENDAFDQKTSNVRLVENPHEIIDVAPQYDSISVPPEPVPEATAKDFAGTYKYTSEDGKEWMIVLTENEGKAERHYSATITVPEGASVDAKTYEGEYRIGRNLAMFNSTEKTGDERNYSVVGFGLEISKDNPKNTNVILKIKGKTAGTLVFAKQ